MATPRLPFLYPQFLRSIRSCEPNTYRSIRHPPGQRRAAKANLHTSQRRAQEAFQERYGPAAEPRLPPPPKPTDAMPLVKPQEPRKEPSTTLPSADNTQESPTTKKVAAGTGPEDKIASKATPDEKKPDPVKDAQPLATKALDVVSQVPSPTQVKEEAHRHPHLHASPYEHHFDTYSLVQELAKNGFSQDQAVTIMKAVRSMLAVNLDLAKDGLVSKSDVENETYLFRAACSELRTTLQTSRNSESQRQRSQRAQLQHETDILSQKMTQDLIALREELKAMFHNRKMAVQEEKQKSDGMISELNYEITVLLNSDSKSEVEGLRWVLTRRAAMAIAISASMTLAALNYNSYLVREKEEVERRKAATKKAVVNKAEARYTTPSRTQGTQTDEPPGGFEESLG